MTPEQECSAAAEFTAFATLGVLSATQDLARITLSSIDGADPELVAEETMSLVATATARAAEVGLRATPAVAGAVIPSMLGLPFAYRDYLVGGAILVQNDPGLMDGSEEAHQRLQRKQSFYATHLPPGQFPGEKALGDKMGLWMGRISPPKLPETPTERLAKLELVPTLLTHLKLVLAFGRRLAEEA